MEFFTRPTPENFAELTGRAERAGCSDTVSKFALEFLETGNQPYSVTVSKDGVDSSIIHQDWPLPLPDYLLPLLRSGDPHPHYNVLIDMAIAQHRPDEVLRWYGLWCMAAKEQRAPWRYGPRSYNDKIAAAVSKSHPDRALAIYRGCIDENLGRAHISAYEAVAAYLKKLRPVFKALDRGTEWNDLIAEIRAKHRNRPRFMEVLDRLEARSILEQSRSRK